MDECRILLLAVGLSLAVGVSGQPLTGPAAVAGYSPAEKQLLVRSTAAFIQFLNQESLDKDTVMLIACRITGVPFLLAWAEDPDSTGVSPGAQLINAGQIGQAVKLFGSLRGQARTQPAVELATWYLHQPGAHKKDLDSAKEFIRVANNPLNLTAEYQRQTGHIEESKNIYRQLTISGNKTAAAIAWLHLATLHQRLDSTDLSYLSKALSGFQNTQNKTKEIECLGLSALYHAKIDPPTCEREIERVLGLQRYLGFRHCLFAQYFLSYLRLRASKLIEAMALADSAFANMRWANMPALESTFYMRIGVVYKFLGKGDEALVWYKKGLERPSRDTELFWFKSMLFAYTLLTEENRWQEAFELVTGTTAKFPPVTRWQKAQELDTKAEIYRHFHNDALADRNQRAFLKLLNGYPDLDPFGELNLDIKDMAGYYVGRSDLKMAGSLLKIVLKSAPIMANMVDAEKIFYKLDSAQGRYSAAFNHYMRYKAYDDSMTNLRERAQFEEINVRFAA